MNFPIHKSIKNSVKTERERAESAGPQTRFVEESGRLQQAQFHAGVVVAGCMQQATQADVRIIVIRSSSSEARRGVFGTIRRSGKLQETGAVAVKRKKNNNTALHCTTQALTNAAASMQKPQSWLFSARHSSVACFFFFSLSFVFFFLPTAKYAPKQGSKLQDQVTVIAHFWPHARSGVRARVRVTVSYLRRSREPKTMGFVRSFAGQSVWTRYCVNVSSLLRCVGLGEIHKRHHAPQDEGRG